MSSEPEPVVLELAPLPRDQVGPFLLLGLDKSATAEQIEAHSAQRVLWARKGRIRTPLEDINWAREALRDSAQRTIHEVGGLNGVLSDGYLHKLAESFGMEGRPGTVTGPRWEPLSGEIKGQNLEGSQPAPPDFLPSPESEAAGIVLPELVQEFPSAIELLRLAVQEPIDPWSL